MSLSPKKSYIPTSFSIFDHQTSSKTFKFSKPESKHKQKLASLPAFETNPTICTNPVTGATLEGIFKLHNNLLVHSQNEKKSSSKQVLDLQYARVKIREPDSAASGSILQITKNGTLLELYLENTTVAEQWMESLRSFCVFTKLEDKYMPLRFFEERSFSSVYVAKNKENSQLFAIKRFPKEILQEPLPKAEFLNQVTIMRTLDHPNIVKLHEIYETPSALYLVKQYDPANTLEFLIFNFPILNSKPSLSSVLFSKALLILLLKSAAGTGLIDKDGHVKIIDFFLLTKSNKPDMLNEGSMSPGYTAPEVFKPARSASYDERINVFSVGCILFEMLFGFPLFCEQDPSRTLDRNKSFSYAATSQFINQEIRDPQSKINKQGLKLLLDLLEPDFKKRVSASQALKHPYFKIDAEKAVTVQKNKETFVRSINKFRSESEICVSPSFSCSQPSFNNDLFNVAGEKLCFTSPRKKHPLYIPLESGEFPERGRKEILLGDSNHCLQGDNNVSPSPDSFDSPRNVPAFSRSVLLDKIVKSQKGEGPGRILLNHVEDNGELSDTDDDSGDRDIEAFLDSHKIEISMKNPGKSF